MRNCKSCALSLPQTGDRPLACMSKTGPARGWYVEPGYVCVEWTAQAPSKS